MSKKPTTLIADDGATADEVGVWAKEKHRYITEYVHISRYARQRFIGEGRAGCTYIDLFCGAGRSRIKGSDEHIDGSAVAAWEKSVEGGFPFSHIHIADADQEKLYANYLRLKAAGANVTMYGGEAQETVHKIAAKLHPEGLHFALIDPYSFGALHHEIIDTLAQFKRMDLLIHFSIMDLRRNSKNWLQSKPEVFDHVTPNWRNHVNQQQSDRGFREEITAYWLTRLKNAGAPANTNMELIRSDRNAPLYYLILAAEHKLAHKFWQAVTRARGTQANLF